VARAQKAAWDRECEGHHRESAVSHRHVHSLQLGVQPLACARWSVPVAGGFRDRKELRYFISKFRLRPLVEGELFDLVRCVLLESERAERRGGRRRGSSLVLVVVREVVHEHDRDADGNQD